jgi:hypothetical protein
VRIYTRSTERKIEVVFREDPFGFRRGKGTSDAIGMLKIISLQLWTWLTDCVLADKRRLTM